MYNMIVKQVSSFDVITEKRKEFWVTELLINFGGQFGDPDMKIVFFSPPHNGRTVLREGLGQVIQKVPGAPYPDVITGYPDGENGCYKERFSPEFVQEMAESVRLCSSPLVFIDIGGRMSRENREICQYGTHAIIVYGKFEDLLEWREFCREIDLPVIAEIYSDYHGHKDFIELEDVDIPMFRGGVHRLKRNENVSERECIESLAIYIADLIA